ncbi:MAG: polysaccharide deacetylase family protein [Candidatus Levybacteria bacterium]|nr:polysaccharide deacetylase family protein [Candidatus Levybacteria bacterium]
MKLKRNTFLFIRSLIVNFDYILGSLLGINKDYLSILCFHSISDGGNRYSIGLTDFKRELKTISQNANFVNIDEAIEVIGGQRVEKPSVVLTFDDGYKDALKVVPLIKEYQIPAVIFILSDRKNANRKELDNKTKLLSTEEIKQLVKEGWTIGCHSATHADFTSLSPSQIKKEIIDSKKSIEKEIGIKIKYFAYPKGVLSDEIIKAVKKAGYIAAFGVWPGNVERGSNKWNIPRIVIDASHSLVDFPAIYSPSVLFLRRITDPLKIWDLFLSL